MNIHLNKINDYLNKPSGALLLAGIFGLFFTWIAFHFNGTGDTGDSIVHYQFAHYAYQHPLNFFDSWAKPVFVLLAAPFALAGFIGIKIFNMLIALATAILLQRAALKLGMAQAWLSMLFLFAAPLYFILMFSGLTEHLFALFMIAGIYLFLCKRCWAAVILFSFLPFVRSEGLLILPVIAFYLVVKRKWIMLPGLLAGHIVYGVAGLFVFGDFLWMFHKNAYTAFSNEYGSGNWLHFVRQMNYVIGVPLYILFVTGLIVAILRLFVKKFPGRNMMPERYILIWGSFLAVFIAHAIFWKFGLFHSMGLKRVLNAVVPLIILIAMDGLMTFTDIRLCKKKLISFSLKFVLVLLVIIFPFTRNPAAVNVSKDLKSGYSELQMADLAEWLKNNNPDIDKCKVYCAHPYMLFQLNIDPFDTNRSAKLLSLSKHKAIPDHAIAIWDNGVSQLEDGVALNSMMNDDRFELMTTMPAGHNHPVCLAVFRKKNPH